MADLNDLIEKIGRDRAIDILSRFAQEDSEVDTQVLTIVSNKGVHHLPSDILRGEVFYASEGNLDFSSLETVSMEFIEILRRLTEKLKSRKWKRIHIIPFGPCALSMQIKLLVYRITRIESVDVFYLGEGEYVDLEINQRNIIVGID